MLFAVKEIPTELLQPNRTYLYFAHVIKGQAYNMAMLQRLLDLESTLIDYERIEDDEGRRLIFFGRYAGLAGMIDTLWALGRRLEAEGYDTPFAQILQAKDYPNLDAAKDAIHKTGEALAAASLPAELTPMVFGFAGYGHVSQGAQEILDLLPHRQLEPEELMGLDSDTPGTHEGGLCRAAYGQASRPGRIVRAAGVLQASRALPRRFRQVRPLPDRAGELHLLDSAVPAAHHSRAVARPLRGRQKTEAANDR